MKKPNNRSSFYASLLFSCLFLFLSLLFKSGSSIFFTLIQLEKELALSAGDKLYISLQSEDNPTLFPNDDNTIMQYKNLYKKLASNTDYKYYELYRQPLYLNDHAENSSSFEAKTDTIITIQSIQISENAQEDFDLKLSSGKYLQHDDFEYTHGELIPVLIGSNLKENYEIGEIFDATYLYFDYKFIIVGILEAESSIKIGSDSISLDGYVVMPSFDYVGTPSDKSEYTSLKIHYANKTSGWVFTSKPNFEKNYNYINSVLKDSSLGRYSLNINSIQMQMELYGFPLYKTFYILILIFLLCSMVYVLLYTKSINFIVCGSIKLNELFLIVLSQLIAIVISFVGALYLHSLFSIKFMYNSFYVPIIIYALLIISITYRAFRHSAKTIKPSP